jgi:hypothetical protein
MHPVFSSSNTVFRQPVALIYHLFHIYFRLKRNLLVTLLPHCMWPGPHRGNWQPQRNRDFREMLSDRVEHMLVNGAAQIEKTATQLERRLRNSISRQRSMPVFSRLSLIEFPRRCLEISWSVTRFSGSFV